MCIMRISYVQKIAGQRSCDAHGRHLIWLSRWTVWKDAKYAPYPQLFRENIVRVARSRMTIGQPRRQLDPTDLRLWAPSRHNRNEADHLVPISKSVTHVAKRAKRKDFATPQ